MSIRRIGFARQLATKRYVESCSILRQTLQDDQQGGFGPTDSGQPWPVVHAAVRCRVDPTRQAPREQQSESRITVEGAFDIAFPNGTDVKAGDRVLVTTLSNRIFEIVGPRYASEEVSRIMASEEVI